MERKRVRTRKGLPIVRFQRLNLRDYPGRLCAKVLVPGCNFRCPYCDKKDVIFNHSMGQISERTILNHLYRVKGFITGLCIGGGEPTLHNSLLQFAYKVKSLGFKVKLDTNGTRPRLLKKMMEEKVIDYIAMEVKAPLNRYTEVVRYKVNLKDLQESIKLLRKGRIDHEFRTTVIPGSIDSQELEEIARLLVGAKRFVIQQHTKRAREYFKIKPYTKNELNGFKELILPYFADCRIRY